MSVVPDSSADVQIADITSVTEAVSLQSVTFIDLTIPDSPNSPVQQSSPAPHVPIVRPGEQGSLALMPRRADLTDLQGTVFQPIVVVALIPDPVSLLKNVPPTSFDPSAPRKDFPCQQHHLTTT
ncbi:unnamed protein product [Clavelina lepadiformis]|uniref:Uncharacterized protein n=1 Tax=Clavelina lepadiformis TaxID=159417 RepID=A0ABP0FCL0_CLALP